MILISHYLPVQTHQDNDRPIFSNFFGESTLVKAKKLEVNYAALF